jgi:hypothetical protein
MAQGNEHIFNVEGPPKIPEKLYTLIRRGPPYAAQTLEEWSEETQHLLERLLPGPDEIDREFYMDTIGG